MQQVSGRSGRHSKDINDKGTVFLQTYDIKNPIIKQLIDIAGVDYPEDEKRFQLIYLLLFNCSSIIYSYTNFSYSAAPGIPAKIP